MNTAVEGASSAYRDRFISCDGEALRVRFYYLPFGSKVIRYESIRAFWRFDRSLLRARLRLWGTSNPRYWASLDPRRPGKAGGLVIDTGRHVKAVITPDDPDAVAAIISERTGIPVRVDNRILFV